MNYIANRLVIRMLCLLAGAAGLGCTDSKPTPPPAPAAVDPVAAFDRVVINLGHYLEQLRAESSYIENDAYFDIRHHSAVTKHELTPPKDAKGDYEGLITVTTTYNISVRPPVDKSESEDTESESKKNRLSGDELAAGGEDGGEGGDPDLQLLPVETPAGFLPKPIAKSQADEIARTYRLVFRNDLWELVEESNPPTTEPKPDPEETTEFASTTFAVKRALNQQHINIGRP